MQASLEEDLNVKVNEMKNMKLELVNTKEILETAKMAKESLTQELCEKNTQLNAYRSVGSEVDCRRWKNTHTEIKSFRQQLSEEKVKNENQIRKIN